jgi:GNAT superfamily N-acetyltransferase
MLYEFKEFDGLNQTPAIGLIARAWPEMLAQGTAPQELIGGWDQQAIVALAGDVPVGVITYSHEKWRKLVWIHLGYVVPELRRKGIYRMLWERVVKAAQKLEAAEIHGGTHVHNTAMLECARRLGRAPLFVTTRFQVPAIAAPIIQPKPKGKRR